MAKEATIQLEADTAPLELFIHLLNGLLQISERRFSTPRFSFEPARIESDNGAADAGKLAVTLYPSDALIRFVAALWAADSDLCIIKKTSHTSPLLFTTANISRGEQAKSKKAQ